VPDRRIAAFDFDGTLTRRDTLVPFLVHHRGARAVAAAVAATAPVAARARLDRLEDEIHHRDAVKVALLRRLYAGGDLHDLRAAGERFAASLPGRLRPEMVSRLAWHRARAHELVLVSAGLACYLEPFGRDHGFDQVIAVELAADDHGRLTGELARPNVRGPEKAVRLRDWLGGEQPSFLWAYGNSSGDAELLAMADAPTWV